MSKSNRYILKSAAYHAVFLLIVYILQAEVFSYIPILGYTPALLPLAAVAVAMMEGNGNGSLFGLFAGIFCDISFHQPAALMTLTLTVIGWLVGRLSETVVRRGFFSLVVVGFLSLICVAFVQMLGLLFTAGTPLSKLLATAFAQAFITIIFTFPIYWAVKFLVRRLRIQA